MPAERWWNFNDELVTLEEWEREGKKGGTNAVGVTLVEGAEGGAPRIFSSKTAYMLNYTRVKALRATAAEAAPAPPEHAHKQNEAEVAKLQAEVKTFNKNKEQQERKLDERKGLHSEVGPQLAAESAGPTVRWVGTEWLQRAMSTSIADVNGPGEMDNAPLMCQHKKADPCKVQQMKLITKAAYDVFTRRFGGGPELRAGDGDLCEACCKQMFDADEEKAGHEESGGRMASLLKQAPQSAPGPRYLVDKHLAKNWRRWHKEGRKDANADLYCACSLVPSSVARTSQLVLHPETVMRLKPAVERIEVGAEAKQAVEALFPETHFFDSSEEACPKCSREREELRRQRSTQKAQFLRLFDGAPLPGSLPQRLVVLPEGWREKWVAFVDGGPEPPPPLRPDGLLSADGKLQVNPAVADGPWPHNGLFDDVPGHAFRSRLKGALAAQFDLVTEEEYARLIDSKTAQEEKTLPRCTVEAPATGRKRGASGDDGLGGAQWRSTPLMCDESVRARRQSTIEELGRFTNEPLTVQVVRERDTATSWKTSDRRPRGRRRGGRRRGGHRLG